MLAYECCLTGVLGTLDKNSSTYNANVVDVKGEPYLVELNRDIGGFPKFAGYEDVDFHKRVAKGIHPPEINSIPDIDLLRIMNELDSDKEHKTVDPKYEFQVERFDVKQNDWIWETKNLETEITEGSWCLMTSVLVKENAWDAQMKPNEPYNPYFKDYIGSVMLRLSILHETSGVEILLNQSEMDPNVKNCKI